MTWCQEALTASQVHMSLHAAENLGVGTDLHVGRVKFGSQKV